MQLNGGALMYCVISQWTATEDLTDELEETVRSAFVPGIMALGAVSVHFVQTDQRSMQVVTVYPDEETANVAREKQEAIRAQAVNQMPVQYVGEVRGRVFANG